MTSPLVASRIERLSCLAKDRALVFRAFWPRHESFLPTRRGGSRPVSDEHQPAVTLKSVGYDDFLTIDVPPREMLLDPMLPERSLAMLYAPRGIGKTLLALSIGVAVASGSQLLRWHAPRQRRVLYVDGEMPLVSLQERLRSIAAGLGAVIPND
jgi:hypothetical protein